MKKNYTFLQRLGFAIEGIRAGIRSEQNLKIQLICGLGAIGILIATQPEPIWWAIFGLTIASVLAAELMNTALEAVIDKLHPEKDPRIGMAKDCAAGAVLLLSMGSLAVLAAFIVHVLRS